MNPHVSANLRTVYVALLKGGIGHVASSEHKSLNASESAWRDRGFTLLGRFWTEEEAKECAKNKTACFGRDDGPGCHPRH
jgi:hypothetical protein